MSAADDAFDVEEGGAAASSGDAPDVISRVELIDDGEEPPPPPMAAAASVSDGKGAGPEILQDDGPFHPNFDESVAAAPGKKRAVPTHVDDGDEGPAHPATFERIIVDGKNMRPVELSPPDIRPDHSAFEDDGAYRQKAKGANPPPFHSTSVGTPVEDPPSSGALRQDNNIPPSSGALLPDNDIVTRTNPREDGAIATTNVRDAEGPSRRPTNEQNRSGSRTANLGRESSVPGITEAYLVDDNIIVATPAEPQLPWYKQRRARLLFGFVAILVVVLVISLGVTLSADRTVTQYVTTTSPPTTSAMPSSHPTGAPSSSGMPSLAPSFCSDKITANTRQVELLRSNPTSLIVAVNGKNLVVAWKQFTGTLQVQGSFYTAFYSLSDDDSWELAGYFIEASVIWREYDNPVGYDIALSDQTAIIGLPARNAVYIYGQNSAGLWEKVSSPEPKDQVSDCGGFGSSVDICDDLVVVSDSSWCSGITRSWAEQSNNAAYLFELTGRQWKEVGRMILRDPFQDHPINDDRIAEAISNVEVCGAKYTVDGHGGEAHIYQWDETTQTSVLFQRLSTSDSSTGFGQRQFDHGEALALDGDILVVGSANQTHIYSQENAGLLWEETVKLDQSYDSYEISGRVVIATNETGVYSINIEDCTLEMPAIAESASDEECHPVSIATSFWLDPWYGDPSEEEGCFVDKWLTWEVSIVLDAFLESDSMVVTTISPRDDQECGYTSSTCLYPGRYKLKFNTDWGYHCYNVTLDFLESDGEPSEPAIKFHGCTVFWAEDVAFFDVPYDPTTLRMGPPTPPPQSYQPTPVMASDTPFPAPVTPFPSPVLLSAFPTWSPTDESPILISDSPAHSQTTHFCETYTTKKACTKATAGCIWDETSDPACSSG